MKDLRCISIINIIILGLLFLYIEIIKRTEQSIITNTSTVYSMYNIFSAFLNKLLLM